jgi:hypothetical protein
MLPVSRTNQHCLACCAAHPASGMGQTEPSSFVAATAELASIADADETWRPSTVRPRPSWRPVFPRNRRPRRPGVAPAAGQFLPHAPQKKIGVRSTMSPARNRWGRASKACSPAMRWRYRLGDPLTCSEHRVRPWTDNARQQCSRDDAEEILQVREGASQRPSHQRDAAMSNRGDDVAVRVHPRCLYADRGWTLHCGTVSLLGAAPVQSPRAECRSRRGRTSFCAGEQMARPALRNQGKLRRAWLQGGKDDERDR